MKCIGKFKFKGLEKRDGGVFTNAQGKEITYKESYALKVDENIDNVIYDRVFKVATDSALLDSLAQLKPYQEFTLELDVIIYRNSIRLVPVAIK